MPSRAITSAAQALALALLTAISLACDKKGDDTGEATTAASSSSSSSSASDSATTAAAELRWYSTCGDPVCSGYGGPWDGVAACGAIKEGDPCDQAGAECDFQSECNARLICADADPKLGPGGCPISRAAFKKDIDYLDAGARASAYRDLLGLRLATYSYRGRGDGKRHLGIILDDHERGIWADPANDRIDLYGYSSLAIAGVQAQADELSELRGQLHALQRELSELRAETARCRP
jgi:hypothetical protein